MVAELDEGLQHWSALTRRVLGQDVGEVPGAGAAGGLGAALAAFLGAHLRSGVDLVMEAAGLARHLEGSDLVITGEGRLDGQTLRGKVPLGVARLAKRAGLPVVAIVGAIGEGAEEFYRHGIDAVESITPGPMSLEEAMEKPGELIAAAAGRVMRLLLVGRALAAARSEKKLDLPGTG